MSTARILRILAAAAILVGGLVHLDLYWNASYRFASPDVNFGRSVLLNVVGSGVLAVAIVWRREWFVRASGIAMAAGTLALFAYTHSGNTFLGFTSVGATFDPSPQAQIALIVEIVAIVLLGATFLPAVNDESADSGLALLGPAIIVAAVVLIGFNLRWNTDDSTPAAGAGAVSIKGFAFNEPEVTVAKGTTVTWTNDDGVGHSVNAADDTFNSERLEQGDTFPFTFDTSGEFAYVCNIHPYMAGTIIVSG